MTICFFLIFPHISFFRGSYLYCFSLQQTDINYTATIFKLLIAVLQNPQSQICAKLLVQCNVHQSQQTKLKLVS